MAKKTRKLTRAEVVKIAALLDGKMITHGDRIVSYIDGWDDNLVASRVSSDINATHVAGVRKELYGNMYEARKQNKAEDMERRISELRVKVEGLSITLTELYRLHARLCDNLQVNRVLNVGHLRGNPPITGAEPEPEPKPKTELT